MKMSCIRGQGPALTLGYEIQDWWYDKKYKEEKRLHK